MRAYIYILMFLFAYEACSHPRNVYSHSYSYHTRGEWYNSQRHRTRHNGPTVRKQLEPNPNVVKLTEEFRNQHPVVLTKQKRIGYKPAMLGQTGALKANEKLKKLTNEFHIQHRQTMRQFLFKREPKK